MLRKFIALALLLFLWSCGLFSDDLHKAAKKGDVATIKKLIEATYEDNVEDMLNVKDSNGQSALMVATKYEHMNAAKELIFEGANVNISDNDGTTALMIAAKSGNEEMVKLLMIHKANINAEDKNGKTALDYAKGIKHKSIIELLSDPPEQAALITLEDGLTLADWVKYAHGLIGKKEEAWDILKQALEYRKEYGSIDVLNNLTIDTVRVLFKEIEIKDEKSAEMALLEVERAKDIVGDDLPPPFVRIEAMAYHMLGDFDNAVKSYKRYLKDVDQKDKYREDMVARLMDAKNRKLPEKVKKTIPPIYKLVGEYNVTYNYNGSSLIGSIVFKKTKNGFDADQTWSNGSAQFANFKFTNSKVTFTHNYFVGDRFYTVENVIIDIMKIEDFNKFKGSAKTVEGSPGVKIGLISPIYFFKKKE